MTEPPSDKTPIEETPKPKRGKWRIVLFILPLLWLVTAPLIPSMTAAVYGHRREMPPEKAFSFRNTTAAFKAPVFLLGYYVGPIGAVIGMPIGVLCMPAGLVADLLEVPGNIATTHEYKSTPPLSYLIQKRDNVRLAERLEGGASPNARSKNDKGYDALPLWQAINSRNWEAFELLLAHGAVIDRSLAGEMSNHFGICAGEDVLPYYKRLYEAFPDYPYPTSGYPGDCLIEQYCLQYYGRAEQVSENPVVDEMLQILLEHHFDPNGKALPQSSKTALDYLIFKTPTMAAERRERLVALMRQHGALRYPELAASGAPKLTPLAIDVECVPAFAPVVEMLKYTGLPELYRFSTTYDGVEGAVLVVDIGLKRSKKGQSIDFRQPMEEAHGLLHRPNIPEGVTVDMSLDVPVFVRMVLTLPGQKTPSRLAAFPEEALPVYKAVLCEEWFTLPTCEIYIESYTRERWRQYPREYLQIRKIAANYVRPADQQDPALNHLLKAFMNLDKLPPANVRNDSALDVGKVRGDGAPTSEQKSPARENPCGASVQQDCWFRRLQYHALLQDDIAVLPRLACLDDGESLLRAVVEGEALQTARLAARNLLADGDIRHVQTVALDGRHHQHGMLDVGVQREERHHAAQQVVDAEAVRADDLRPEAVGGEVRVREDDAVAVPHLAERLEQFR